MKKIILLPFWMLLSVIAFSQQVNTKKPVTRADYLQKSKNQKTGAWVMLGGGASFILLGDLIGNRESSSFGDAGTGVILAGLGALSMIGSIPMFLASGKNKKKGLSLSFKNEKAVKFLKESYVNRAVPSLNFKIIL